MQFVFQTAEVVKLADTPVSGAGARKGVGVQVPSSALCAKERARVSNDARARSFLFVAGDKNAFVPLPVERPLQSVRFAFRNPVQRSLIQTTRY